MRERYHRKVNVLGTEVSVVRVDRAVNMTMGLLRGQGIPTVYFLSAVSSLLCQNSVGAAEYVRSCDLVLPGDRHMEKALLHHQETEKTDTGIAGIGEFADDFLKHFFAKLNRTGRSIYAVMAQEEHLASMKEYMSGAYPNLEVNGSVLAEEPKGEADRIVNEINAYIPDVVFVCLPAEEQIRFMQEHAAMMNTSLCILIESIQPLIRKETKEIPEFVQAFHMEGIYAWFQKEQKIRNTIIGSVFKKKVLNEAMEEEEHNQPESEDDGK